jgi:hypothetical protein
VLRKLGLVFAALAFFTIAGGHWAIVQAVAWAEMLHDYTMRTGSVAVAVEQTLDGHHPCEICLRIAAAKKLEAEAKSDRQKPESSKSGVAKTEKSEKALPLAGSHSPVLTAINASRFDMWPLLAASSREDQPPTPPPRFV